MRKTFADELYKQMKSDDRIWLLTADLGFGMWDKIRDELPDRFINCGAAEQATLDIAVGLALEGKIPFVYSITPFLLYRPFETIRTYINHENIEVKLIGSGRDRDYSHDGISHWAEDAKPVLDLFPNIIQFWPDNLDEIPTMVTEMVKNGEPSFISLQR